MFTVTPDKILTADEVKEKIKFFDGYACSDAENQKISEISQIILVKRDTPEKISSLAGRMHIIEEGDLYKITPVGLMAFHRHSHINDDHITLLTATVQHYVSVMNRVKQKVRDSFTTNPIITSAPAVMTQGGFIDQLNKKARQIPNLVRSLSLYQKNIARPAAAAASSNQIDPNVAEKLEKFEQLLSDFEGNVHLDNVIQEARKEADLFRRSQNRSLEQLESIVNKYRLLLLKKFMQAIKLT